jgi:hypothetical protein
VSSSFSALSTSTSYLVDYFGTSAATTKNSFVYSWFPEALTGAMARVSMEPTSTKTTLSRTGKTRKTELVFTETIKRFRTLVLILTMTSPRH